MFNSKNITLEKVFQPKKQYQSKMNNQEYIVVNANEAVARMAYKTNEVCAIYPITPASQMSELVEEWSALHYENVFGSVPLAYAMQSEAGVAGAMHGALQTGSLATTFTASQGLLLMLPNMYKIAGELTPNVIHVATRTLATHALSVFGDHSDVMAVRHSGYAMLASSSVQEALDFGCIAQCATLESRIPFVHFFDGFRTSHEKQKIKNIPDRVIQELLNGKTIQEFRARALNPERPVLRGTSQTSETFFQSREASNSFYELCPLKVQEQLDRFAKLTGREYQLFDYVGHPEADSVIIAMASATETIAETVHYLNRHGQKVGVIKVRLFRPFSKKHLLEALPKSCKQIAVLDKTKEPGAPGEPLFLDINNAILEAFHAKQLAQLPTVLGGRFGLASKEFTPGMVSAVFENLTSETPKQNFSVGITDDITHLSLPVTNQIDLQKDNFQALFYGNQENGFESGFKELLSLVQKDTTIQAYTEFDYDKSKGKQIHNLRLSKKCIKAPYLIQEADFIACTDIDFLLDETLWNRIKKNGILVVDGGRDAKDIWEILPKGIQQKVQEKEVGLYVMDNSSVTTVFEVMVQFSEPNSEEPLQKLIQVNSTGLHGKESTVDPVFKQTFLGKLLAGKGNALVVGDFPVDGTYPTDTSKFLPAKTALELPVWDVDACTQCGACSMACPQGAIRIKAYDDNESPKVSSWKSKKATWLDQDFHTLNYTVQVNPEQCTSCNHCIEACAVDALELKDSKKHFKPEKRRWEAFKTIPEFDRSKIDTTKIAQQQLQEPLFKYSRGEDGCGQAPYLKMLSQLFGDRMLVANATGASSIFGGALPTTPWSKNAKGQGPAWSNSLFEDNAEFGLGFQLSQIQKQKYAKHLLLTLIDKLPNVPVTAILEAEQTTEVQVNQQRMRIAALKTVLYTMQNETADQLLGLADSLIKKSIWIVGGDGWAYDIGFGGIDHALASGENINILVLDNEIYSNTGGQLSKATPMGATAKFGYNGKAKQKKNLGKMAMTYESVYVASIAIGADKEQTLKAITEAEAFKGPSLLLAYCHSPAHGIDMKAPSKHQKAAVASGHWPLYRYDPRRIAKGMSPLQLDAESPTIGLEQFMALEERFAKVLSKNKATSEGATKIRVSPLV